MNNEIILHISPDFYYTWNDSLEWFLTRPGYEGELNTRIADILSEEEYSTEEIISTLNYAYRNCIAIYRMRLPQYSYDTNFRESDQPEEKGYSFTDQCATQILLAAQPDAKKSEGIKKLIAKFDRNLYGDERFGNESDLEIELENLKNSVEVADIDFTPCPDMESVKFGIEFGQTDFCKLTNEYNHKCVKFLIDLIPGKEDKLYLLDHIDKAYQKYAPLPF